MRKKMPTITENADELQQRLKQAKTSSSDNADRRCITS
jgi:hypothetical protein